MYAIVSTCNKGPFKVVKLEILDIYDGCGD
jgi:hypothetical protein